MRINCQDGGHPCTIHDEETEEASLLSVGVQCQDQLAGDISFYKDGRVWVGPSDAGKVKEENKD